MENHTLRGRGKADCHYVGLVVTKWKFAGILMYCKQEVALRLCST